MRRSRAWLGFGFGFGLRFGFGFGFGLGLEGGEDDEREEQRVARAAEREHGAAHLRRYMYAHAVMATARADRVVLSG